MPDRIEPLSPIAQRAYDALVVLNPSADQAAFLLESWSGASELTADEATAVTAAYRARVQGICLIADGEDCIRAYVVAGNPPTPQLGVVLAVARRSTSGSWFLRVSGATDVEWFNGVEAVTERMYALGGAA